MSDFLSNFGDDNYKKTLDQKKQNKQKESKSPKTQETISDAVPSGEVKRKRKRKKRSSPQNQLKNEKDQSLILDDATPLEISDSELEEAIDGSYNDEEHEVQVDPTYKAKKRKKQLMIGIGAVIACILVYVIYYQVTRVNMPDFTDKTMMDVKKWATENKMETSFTSKYSLKKDVNDVMKQSVPANKKVKKGSQLTFTISEGPDPEQAIVLPDFAKMSMDEANQWVEKNKAENLSVLDEYSNKVEKGKFIRIEFNNKEVTEETYKRRDNANVYYSKGKETFEKNISVPDFVKKSKPEVEEWAKKNEVKIKFSEADSDKIEEGMVISQSIAKNTKIAKHDTLTVTMSLGKAVVIPNFNDFTPETAVGAVEGLEVTVQELFANNVGYGHVISQSIEAGKKITLGSGKTMKVVYSIGQPYIKSYFGQLEGDIPKLLYDDFNSKGANITYDVYYMDSDQERGHIVKMSAWNQYIPTNYNITFGISNGSNAPDPVGNPDTNQED